MPPYGRKKKTVSFKKGTKSGSKSKTSSTKRQVDKLSKKNKRNNKKSDMQIGNVVKDGTNSSISYFTRLYKKNNPFYKNLKGTAVNTYLTHTTARHTANVGGQVFAELFTLQGGSVGSASPAITNELDLIRSYINTNTLQGSKTTRYVVSSVNEELLITNQDNSKAEIIIYDVFCKRSCLSSVTGLVNGSLVDQGLTGWSVNVQGIRCETVLRDNRYWYVAQKNRFILEAGESHIHKFYVKKNIMVNMDTIAADSYPYVNGVTMCKIICARGMPCNDTINKSQVSTGTVTLDTVWNKQIRYRWISDTTQTAHGNSNVVSGFTNAESTMMPQDAVIDLSSTAA